VGCAVHTAEDPADGGKLKTDTAMIQKTEVTALNNNDFGGGARKGHPGKTLRWAIQGLAGLACAMATVFALAQADGPRLGATVSVPNGYLNIQVDDMRGMSTAGLARWSRRWDGKEWKFNAHWESLSQSWTNLTGSVTDGGGTVGGALATASQGTGSALQASSDSGCWVMVDEDWQPSKGSVLVDDKPIGLPMLPDRTAPFNKVMGDDTGTYPPPRIVSIDYASLCKGITMSASPVRDMEALRLKNELYLGDNGRYAFSNRAVLEKRAVRMLPAAAAATLDQQLGTGKFTAAPVSLAKGFRWLDKGGDWIDYNTQGQVVAYGDRNNNTVWLVRDTNGILRGVVDANGHVMFTLHYANGLIAEVRDYPIPGMSGDLPARSVKYQYDAANRLTAVVDVRGNTVRYGYDTANHLVSITDQEGRVEKYDYAGASVSKRTAPDGGVTDYLFEYDDVNKQFTSRITGPQTGAGRRVEELTHNRSGQLVRRVVNGRVDDEVRYDTGARTESHTNARGFIRKITKDEYDQVVETVNEDGTSVKDSYSAVNLKRLEHVDEAGVKTQYQYDVQGNLSRQIEAAGTLDAVTTEHEVNGLGQLIKLTVKGRTEANGTTTPDTVVATTYDEQGQMRSLTDSEGNVEQYAYNRLGNLMSLTDAQNNTTSFTLDASGYILKSSDALKRETSLAYDKVGNLVSMTDSMNRQSKIVYDAMNRVVQVVGPIGNTTSMQYDAQGLLLSSTDPDGRKIQFEYDNFLRLVKQTDAAGNVTEYSYQISDGSASGALGSLSEPTEVRYPTFTLRKRFDALQRLTSETLVNPGVADTTKTVAYDQRGLPQSETNPYGKVHRFSYDARGNPLSMTDALGNSTRMQYDVRGQLLQLNDANNNTRQYRYDRNGRITKEILPLGQISSVEYDASGNVLTQVNENGQKQVMTYDAANRIKEIKTYAQSGTLERTIGFARNAADHLTSWSDDLAGNDISGTLSYDEAGRKIREVVSYPGGFTMSYGYAYSPSGRKTQLTWPDGTNIGYGYGSNGELATVAIPNEGTIAFNQFKWLRPVEAILPGGTLERKTYDGLLNETAFTVKGPAQQNLFASTTTYGKAYEPLTRSLTSFSASTAKQISYTYDDELRLVKAVTDTGGLFGANTEIFTLDAIANRTAYSRETGAWLYDANNRLKQRGTGASATTYEYDDAGNLVRKNEPGGKVTLFSYNSSKRLVAVKDGEGRVVAKYGYDPFGRRIWKEQYRDFNQKVLSQAVRIYFLYADEGLIAEASQAITADGAGAAPAVITAQYGVRPEANFNTNVLFSKTRNDSGEPSVVYLHTNELGAPVQASDRNGKVVWAADYDAFGRAQITTPAELIGNAAVNIPFRLPGQTEDPETGLHYNYFRDYDPQTGRYIQSDPIGIKGGINTYSYVGANPLNSIDPLGLSCMSTDGRTYCSYPGGPSFSVPRPPGYPDTLDKDSWFYHKYDVQRDLGGADPRCVMGEMRQHATPGNSAGASSNGTVNVATVGPMENPVISYVTKNTRNGDRLIVNITFNNGAFADGYVARGIDGNTVHTWGEGTSMKQYPHTLGIISYIGQYAANELLWGRQMDEFIKKCTCQK
jgi:RHS repeat-associated protein